MKYRWECTWSKGGGPWSDPDYEVCGARSRKTFSSRDTAEKAADRHTKQTGHKTTTYRISRK